MSRSVDHALRLTVDQWEALAICAEFVIACSDAMQTVGNVDGVDFPLDAMLATGVTPTDLCGIVHALRAAIAAVPALPALPGEVADG